jgi:hypothetical protein
MDLLEVTGGVTSNWQAFEPVSTLAVRRKIPIASPRPRGRGVLSQVAKSSVHLVTDESSHAL